MSAFTMVWRLFMGCALNALALALVVAWWLDIAPWGIKGALIAGCLGWCMLPAMPEARAILKAMQAAAKDRQT